MEPINLHEDGGKMLYRAAAEGNAEQIVELVRQGADVETRAGRFCWKPIYAAALRGHLDCVRALLEAGADADLHIASCDETSCGWTPLHAAAQEGQFQVLRLLIQHGANLDLMTQERWTPLLQATLWGKADCALALIKAGADVWVRDVYGLTALHCAAAHGTLPVVKQLLRHSVHLCDVKDKDGMTPALHCQKKWATHVAAHASIPKEVKAVVVGELNKASARNALWRGRGVTVMLEARFAQGQNITGGAQGDAELRNLMTWLVLKPQYEQHALFRLVVSYLGDVFAPKDWRSNE
ncbi:unnamed protein product [Chrysoparadoxa australica]